MVQAGPCRALSDPELVVTNPTTIEIKLCPLLCRCSLLLGYEKEVVPSTGRLWKQTWGGRKQAPERDWRIPSGDALGIVSLRQFLFWVQKSDSKTLGMLGQQKIKTATAMKGNKYITPTI